MTSAYIYTPDIWPPLGAAILLAALALYSWHHRRVLAARPLAVSLLFATLWLLGVTFMTAAVAPAAKILWFKFQAAWQLPAATATACFALEYANPGRWLTRRNLAILAVMPLLSIVLIATNSAQLVQLEMTSDGSMTRNFTTLGSIAVVYGLSLSLINMAALLWLFMRSPQHHWPAAMMLAGDVAGRGLYGLFIFSAAPLPFFTLPDSFVAVLLLNWTMYAIALFRFRILDPLPMARRAAIEQMREGMVVFDDHWRIASLNPTAATMLSTSAARARGKTLQEALPDAPDLTARLASMAANPPADAPQVTEMSLGPGPEARRYTLEVSPLKDFRGLTIGQLLLLFDVTEQRRAQAQLLDQRWAQATLQERERLAHELHDSLSQSLAFLNVQAEAAQLYLLNKRDEDARSSLVRLAEVAREMQSDVRELIGNLLAVTLPSEGFCATMRHIVSRFERFTGLAARLDIDDSTTTLCDSGLLPAHTGVQLIRIAQEALANVRKHAGCPSRVGIEVRVEAHQIQLVVQDDGAGFDPTQPGDTGKHFGLQIMRQRVEGIGGQMAIDAAPGQGVRVEVRVPLRGAAESWGEDAVMDNAVEIRMDTVRVGRGEADDDV